MTSISLAPSTWVLRAVSLLNNYSAHCISSPDSTELRLQGTGCTASSNSMPMGYPLKKHSKSKCVSLPISLTHHSTTEKGFTAHLRDLLLGLEVQLQQLRHRVMSQRGKCMTWDVHCTTPELWLNWTRWRQDEQEMKPEYKNRQGRQPVPR